MPNSTAPPVGPPVSNDSRYLTEEEKAGLRAFAAALPGRLRAAEALERAEGAAVSSALGKLRADHPTWDGGAWPDGLQAERVAIRYAAHAMLFDDDTLFEKKGLDWCRQTRASAGVPPAVAAAAVDALRDGFRQAMPAADYSEVEPYLVRARADAAAVSDPSTTTA